MQVNNKTIIITDPCYIINKKQDSDWEKCDYGDNMKVLGFTNYLVENTIYGDWSCTTYDSDSGKEIGKFCADTGLVAVFLLDEVLAYNPDFNYHTTKPWTTTVIPNFTGDVTFKVMPEEDWDIVSVVGEGNVNFHTEQTGFNINKKQLMKIDYDFKNHPWYLNLLILLVLFGLGFGLFVAIGALFMVIWNNVIPSAFGLTTISLRQSIDLLLLAWVVRIFTNTCTKEASTLSITDKKD